MNSSRLALLCLAAACGAAAPALAQPAAPPDAGVSLQRFLARRVTPMIGALDANHDGKISKGELSGLAAKAKPGAQAAGERVFDQMDADKDGAISRAELNAYLTARFKEADTNHDGLLSDAEQQALRRGLSGKSQ
jgi:Ca2+-binding EF-hand superfamily protein